MTVRDLNTKVQQFPSSIIAGFANAKEREFFELEEPADARCRPCRSALPARRRPPA